MQTIRMYLSLGLDQDLEGEGNKKMESTRWGTQRITERCSGRGETSRKDARGDEDKAGQREAGEGGQREGRTARAQALRMLPGKAQREAWPQQREDQSSCG